MGTGSSIVAHERLVTFYVSLVQELLEFAEIHFKLFKPTGKNKKSCRYNHLIKAARRGVVSEELLAKPPKELKYLWTWWTTLNSYRSGDTSLTFAELESWSRLNHMPLHTWEVATLMKLDNKHQSIMS